MRLWFARDIWRYRNVVRLIDWTKNLILIRLISLHKKQPKDFHSTNFSGEMRTVQEKTTTGYPEPLKLLWTCSRASLGSADDTPRHRNSLSKNTSNCSRNFGFEVSCIFAELTLKFSSAAICLLRMKCFDCALEPRTDTWAGHVSTVPASVSWCGCSSRHATSGSQLRLLTTATTAVLLMTKMLNITKFWSMFLCWISSQYCQVLQNILHL